MTNFTERKRIGGIGPTANRRAWKMHEETCAFWAWRATKAAMKPAGTEPGPDVVYLADSKGKPALKLPPLPPAKPTAAQVVASAMSARAGCGFPILSMAELTADPAVGELLQMLTTMRPAGTKTEDDFIAQWIVPLGSKKDDYGNRWVWVGDNPDILFSCHTDTVHFKEGKQQIVFADGMAYAENSDCLGADDTSGIWLMREMIKARVPGLYLFHREEEIGGHGSAHVNKYHDETIGKMRAAIAFDRKGYDNVITHQFGGRCCSETFAKSLGKILGGNYAADPTGSFTDTANYIDTIGECTNLSVGYFGQHGPSEFQDVSFLVQLRDALIHADWSQLEIERKPGEFDMGDDFGGGKWSSYTGYGYGGTRSNWSQNSGLSTGNGKSKRKQKARTEFEIMLEYIQAYPETVAGFLVDLGTDTDELEDYYLGATADDDDDRDDGRGAAYPASVEGDEEAVLDVDIDDDVWGHA
jgi:hypothetical protein